ncbi:hypothetical protein IO49_09285 [Gallibacterium anatis]|nr:hypothetical protein IO49_09285 [Gallibacterium anatis]
MSYITLLKIRLLKKRTFLTKKQQKVLDFFLFLLARKCDLGQGFWGLLRLCLALIFWFRSKGDFIFLW